MSAHTKPLWIYLDQNKWIDLSRTHHSHPDTTKFLPALNKLDKAIKQDRARIPVSSDNIVEIVKAGKADRRQRLAQVMAIFSQARTLAPQHAITPYEIDAALASIWDYTLPPVSLPVFGKGVQFAFGRAGNNPPPESTVQELRLLLDIPTFVTFFIENGEKAPLPIALQKQLQYVVDRTSYIPADIHYTILNSPEFFAHVLSFANEDERHLGLTRFTGITTKIMTEQKRVRDIGLNYDKAMRQRGFAARMTSDPEIQRLLHSSLKKIGKTFSDFLALGQEKLLHFWESIPTIHVEMTLESERDEQRSRDIQLNDVIDVSFLSVAIPYCDIVITERFWVDLAKRNHLDQRYGTILLTNFADLEFYLSTDA